MGSFRIETQGENPSTTANVMAKSWFVTGVVCGLFIWFGMYKIATWDGWKSGLTAEPPVSTGPGIPGPPAPRQ